MADSIKYIPSYTFDQSTSINDAMSEYELAIKA